MDIKGKIFKVPLLLASALLSATAAYGQYTKASLSGTVVDSSGGALSGASVSIESRETGFKQQRETTAQGAFLFPELPVGDYRLNVEKAGFETSVRSSLILTVGQKVHVEIALTVGSITQKLEVASESELVSTDNSTVGQVINTQQIVDLPLDGRTAQSLVFLSAGTVDTTDRYCGLGCHGGVYPGEQQAAVNGSGPGGVNYQLDGAGHNDTYLNTNLPFPNPDAVQEFSLQSSNLTAEYGSAVGGVVNIVTRSRHQSAAWKRVRVSAQRRVECPQLLRAGAGCTEEKSVWRQCRRQSDSRQTIFLWNVSGHAHPKFFSRSDCFCPDCR